MWGHLSCLPSPAMHRQSAGTAPAPTPPHSPPYPPPSPPQKLNHRIEVPRSVPGMVTDRLLVMNFLEGVTVTRLERHTQQ